MRTDVDNFLATLKISGIDRLQYAEIYQSRSRIEGSLFNMHARHILESGRRETIG